MLHDLLGQLAQLVNSNQLAIDQQVLRATFDEQDDVVIFVNGSVELGIFVILGVVQLELAAGLAKVGVSLAVANIGDIGNSLDIHSDLGTIVIFYDIVGISSIALDQLGILQTGIRGRVASVVSNSLGSLRDGLRVGQGFIRRQTGADTSLGVVEIVGLHRSESGGAQCQSHDHGQHSCNVLLHVCFLHKNLFVSDLTSPLSPAVYNVNIIML